MSPYSSPVLSQGQMPPVPWLGRQEMLESLLPVSQGCMPTSASCQGPSFLKFCLPPQVSSLTHTGAIPGGRARQDPDTLSAQTFLLQLHSAPTAHGSHVHLGKPLGHIPLDPNPVLQAPPLQPKCNS